MYPVSNAYKTAYAKNVKSFDVMGTIGNEIFWVDNILKGSLSISKQCSSRNEVQIGSVFISELDATFTGITMTRNSWKGKVITISEGLGIQRGNVTEYEYIPMGQFIISDAKHTQSGVVVTAFDNMAKFDKNFRLTNTRGTAYQMLSLCCANCSVTLGMTATEIAQFPNGSMILTLYEDNDIETYRDFIAWIAQTLAAFAYIDRDGTLKLKQYKTFASFDDVIDSNDRHSGGAVSDFITYYTGVSVVNIKDETTQYYGLPGDDGLTYNLGSNPLMQGASDVMENMARNVLSGMMGIQYSPFEFDGYFGALYDLGDVINFQDGIGSNSYGCIMSIDYKFSDKVKLQGYGSDPALSSAKSKTDKDISGLINKDKKNSVNFYNYLNAESYSIGSTAQNVINIYYATAKDCDVVFQSEILCEATEDSVVEVTYLIDGVAESYNPTETWKTGKHILSLLYYMANGANEAHTFVAQLKCLSGHINIPTNSARAVIWGQGLAAVQDWDGRLQFNERINAISFDDSIGVETFTYSVDVDPQIPITLEFEEDIDVINIDDSIGIETFSAVMYLNKLPLHTHTWAEALELTWADIYDNYLW